MRRFSYVLVFIIAFILCIQPVSARRGCCSWHKGVSGSCRGGMIVCNDGTTSPTCTCDGGSTNSSSSSYSYTPRVTYIYGCTDSNSINYNPKATKDDGSCIKKVEGCMDSNAYNYNSSANVDDGSCIAKVLGCTNNNAINYNIDANTSDGSCLFSEKKVSYKKIKYKKKYKYKFFYKEGKVLRKGKNGKRKITKEIITNENGDVVEKKTIKKEVIKKPINKIIVTKKRD